MRLSARRLSPFLALTIAAGVYAQYYGNSCLINYCPSFCLPYLPYVFQNILATLTFADLGILMRALQSFTTFPAFLRTLQAQSLPLYNAFNSINSAYGGSFFPFLQSALSSPAFGTFAQQVAGGGVQPSLSLSPNFQPQLAISPTGDQSVILQTQSGGDGAFGTGGAPPPAGNGGFGLGNILQTVVDQTEQITEQAVDQTAGGAETAQIGGTLGAGGLFDLNPTGGGDGGALAGQGGDQGGLL